MTFTQRGIWLVPWPNAVIVDDFFTADELAQIRAFGDALPIGGGRIFYKPPELVNEIHYMRRPPEMEWLYQKMWGLYEELAKTNDFRFTAKRIHTGAYYHVFREGHYFNFHDDGPWEENRLTFAVQLSAPEEYTGGRFQFTRRYVAPKHGRIVVFHANTKHAVEKITSGVRRSLVMWVSDMVLPQPAS